MASAEMFTVLAVLEARDKISGQLEKAERSVGRFSESLQRMAGTAEEAGARTDESLLKTASGTDAVELADARLAAARDKLTAATERQAEAERALLEAQGSIATEDELAAAADRLAGAEEAAAASARQLEAAQSELAAAKAAKASEDDLAAAAKAVAEADKLATAAVEELTAAQKQQAALVTSEDVVKAADDLTAAEKRAAAASRELTTAERAQADTAAAAAARTDEAAASQGRFSGAAAKSGAAMSAASKVALGAGVAVAAIGYESVKAATSFQTLTTQLVTTAGEAPSALKQVQQGILQISTTTATSANDLAQSMYVVEASGYNAAHGGLDVLKAATEGARLENSDFKTVANGVTDILKDYHVGADQAANYTSKLVTAVGHGKANFQQFSAALSNILPFGSAVGLKFKDLAGVLAEMTAHGMTAQRASMNMYNAMRNLERPTGVMRKEFKEVGISADDVSKHLSKEGLAGTMQWLSGVAKDNASRLGQTYPAALANLMGSASGLTVALMSTGENAKDVNKAIADIGASSADAQGNVRGFSTVQQTFAFKTEQAKQAIHNTGIAIGTMLLPWVTRIMGAINSVLVPLADWANKHQKLIGLIMVSVGAMAAAVGIIKGIALVTRLWTAAQEMLNVAMEENPIGLIIVLVAGLVAAFVYCWDHFKGFRDFWKGAWKDIQGAAEAGLHFIEHAFASIVGRVESAWAMVRAVSTGLWRWFVSFVTSQVSAIAGRIAWFGHLGSMFAGWMASVSHAVSSGISTVVRFFENLPHTILSLLSGAGSWLVGVGVNLVEGLWNGIASMGSWLYSQISGWIKSVVPGPVLKVLGISSPSKWAHWAGQMVGQGLANGVLGSHSTVSAAAHRLARAVTGTAAGTLSAGLTLTGNAVPALAGTPGLVGAGAGTGGGTVIIDLRGSQVMSDADMRKLADKIGAQMPHALAAAGVRIRG